MGTPVIASGESVERRRVQEGSGKCCLSGRLAPNFVATIALLLHMGHSHRANLI
jgi:hypothetical protein